MAEPLRFGGTFAPERRASLNPIAIACFRLLTFFLPPDFSSPCLYSCITLPTLALPLALVRELFFLVAILLLHSKYSFGSEPGPPKIGMNDTLRNSVWLS